MSILLGILTFVLILTSIFLILLVLAQKAKSDGGMGAAMGGGMAEATFGADTGNVLSIALYLGRIYEGKRAAASGGALPTIEAPLTPAASKTPSRVLVPAATVPTPAPATKH